MSDALLRLPQIIGDKSTTPPTPGMIPLGRSAFLAAVKSGRYPAPIKIGARAVAWRKSELLAAIDQMPTAG